MAQVSFQVVLRARATRAAAEESRLESMRLRSEARARRGATRLVEDEVARLRERQHALDQSLGTWPYWAPATRELWHTLVPLPDAA